jgi:hypothetical protein
MSRTQMSTLIRASVRPRLWAVLLGLLLPLTALGMLHADAGSSGSSSGECDWVINPSPSPAFDHLYGITAVNAQDIWAVGTTQGAGSVQPLTEHWDGTNWSVVANPALAGPSGFFAVDSVSASDVWAIGQFNPHGLGILIEHWNGSQWSIVPTPLPGSADGFTEAEVVGLDAVSSDNAWVVGSSVVPFQHTRGFVMRWDGTTWKVIDIPHPQLNSRLNSISVIGPDDIWIVGATSDNWNGPDQALIEHWDGVAWTIVSSPAVANYAYLGVVEAPSSHDVWALGTYLSANGGANSFFEHWDGAKWFIVRSPNPGDVNIVTGMSVVSSQDVWAVGSALNSSYTHGTTLIEHWDGASWQLVPSPNTSATSSGLSDVVAVTARNVWAVGGDFTQTPSPPYAAHTLIEHCLSVGPTCNGQGATIVGTDASEAIRGTEDDDVIVAGAGNDIVLGLGGSDLICAGDGNDVLIGGAGNDVLMGEAGDDVLNGGLGNDSLDGGPGVDVCTPTPGSDTATNCERAFRN